jgi:hypothetical protein
MHLHRPDALSITDANIAPVAYKLWWAAGRPANRDREFWWQAKADLLASVCQICHIKHSYVP